MATVKRPTEHDVVDMMQIDMIVREIHNLSTARYASHRNNIGRIVEILGEALAALRNRDAGWISPKRCPIGWVHHRDCTCRPHVLGADYSAFAAGKEDNSEGRREMELFGEAFEAFRRHFHEQSPGR